MKNIFIYAAIICTLFAACNISGKEGNDDSSTDQKNKNVSKRDRSITAVNAYNNLFFDSMA
ncbi:MAG: hypothetical protein M3O67_04185, partial [Bacteroidota bacterium]|nr:hypothetical protein [Bacteroidota bacterium]